MFFSLLSSSKEGDVIKPPTCLFFLKNLKTQNKITNCIYFEEKKFNLRTLVDNFTCRISYFLNV